MSKTPTLFDAAEGLRSDEAIAAFLAEAFASEDEAYIAHALRVVARAKVDSREGAGIELTARRQPS